MDDTNAHCFAPRASMTRRTRRQRRWQRRGVRTRVFCIIAAFVAAVAT
jgi:hypothetical protein